MARHGSSPPLRGTKSPTEFRLHPDPAGFVKDAYPVMRRAFGHVRCALHYSKPHELAVAVILSAQCTDEQVNRVTPALFERFPEAADLARAPLSELERLIHSTGFYHNKAKSIQGFARDLVELHGGVIPRQMEPLLKMPGVGRKTANVILQELYEIPSGMVVDTHVARLSKVLGLTLEKDPLRIERDLLAIIPREMWIDWSLYMIRLGRTCCTARKRDCPVCHINRLCISSSVRKGD